MNVTRSMVVVCGLLAASLAGAQKAEKKGEKKAADPMAAQMAQMAKYTEPTEAHQKLKPFVGKWKAESTMWMEPGKPPVKSTGTDETKMILGNRFTHSDFSGNVMGQPFQGHGVMGYDLGKKKYVSFWIDSMGTWFTVMEGTVDPTGKVFTFTGEPFDPMTGKPQKQRWIMKVESDAKHTMEIWGAGPDGKEMKWMEIVYTRS